MNLTPIPRARGVRAATWLLLLLTLPWLAPAQDAPTNSLATHDSSRWERDIVALETRHRAAPPPTNCIVFLGSSSIRLWTNLVADFPKLPVVNCGFGGSQLADAVNFADRLVTPLAPRQVVIYSGGNDLNVGKPADVVYGDFLALVRHLRTRLPSVRVAYIASAPNPARWKQIEQVRRLNTLVAAHCQREGFTFIDVFPLMLGPDGLPKPDIFVADRLHMNPKGYAIWREAVAPHLQ
jgi:lysophospholipase L1-like esterase